MKPHQCPMCDVECWCEDFYYGESCNHCCGRDYDGSSIPDAEPTSRSIDRENAREINRRRDSR